MDCIRPQEIRLEDGRTQIVRCGKCLACLGRRQAEWSSRMRVELDASPASCYFVTLTYDEEHLPWNDVVSRDISDSDFSRVPSVRKKDLQSFHMDLRKRFQQGFYNDFTLVKAGFRKEPSRVPLPEDCHFRYYCTSEYGPEGHRPHYHGFYMNLPEDPDLVFDLFQQVWSRGFVYCEPAQSQKCASYVAKYLINESLVPKDPDADPVFSLMSKGIGKSYLEKINLLEWHRSDPVKRNYIPVEGRRSILPRYLKDKIFDDEMKATILDDVLYKERGRMVHDLQDIEAASARINAEYSAYLESERQALWRFQKNGKIK